MMRVGCGCSGGLGWWNRKVDEDDVYACFGACLCLIRKLIDKSLLMT